MAVTVDPKISKISQPSADHLPTLCRPSAVEKSFSKLGRKPKAGKPVESDYGPLFRKGT
jgi:hypothetical protein